MVFHEYYLKNQHIMPCILSIHKIKFVQNVYLGIIFFVLLILNIFSILPLSCLTAGQYLPPFLSILLYFLENVPECHSKASPLLLVPSILTLFFLDDHRGSQKEVHQFFSSVLNTFYWYTVLSWYTCYW